MKHLLQTALLFVFFTGSKVWADGDHDLARELVKSGEIIPMEQKSEASNRVIFDYWKPSWNVSKGG